MFRTNKNKYIKYSFSQCGEDLIINFIFNALGIKKPTYIDIGAHHPYYLNNTAILYNSGSKGINIEPDPSLFGEFKRLRIRDVNINAGISNEDTKLDFFIMSTSTLNTFSQEEAIRYESLGFKIKKVLQVDVYSINTVLRKFCRGECPDLMNIDAEGVEEIILKDIDFSQNPPTIMCIETITFSTTGNGEKNMALIDFVKSQGYLLYADTHINSIFVRESKWRRNEIQ